MKEHENQDNVVPLFDRPALSVQRQLPLSAYLTLKNVVIGLGVATFLIFLGSAVSARIAFLFAALLGLAGVFFFEVSGRRKWEAGVVEQLRKSADEYERLVREVARNRNDLAVLKKGMTDAGALVRSYGATPGEDVGQRMMKALAAQLSRMGEVQEHQSEEQQDELPLFEGAMAESDAPPSADGEGQIGNHLTDEQVMQLVQAAVKQDRIDLFLQPVVSLPQRKLRFYEMLSRIRIRPEVYLPAARYIAVALRHDLVPVIDNLLLLRGLQMLRDTEGENLNRAFFCNITSLTLNDPKFMGDLVEFIAQNRTLAPRLVFELSQQDLAAASADILPVLRGIARLGCRFSMDRVRRMSFDFAYLEERQIRFVKIEAQVVLAEMKEQGGLQRMKRLKAEMDRNGIDLIVEKVETEKQLLELLDAEIDYGQGYLFGHPELYRKV